MKLHQIILSLLAAAAPALALAATDTMTKHERCGANASAEFNRADFSMNFGLPKFSPQMKLAIQVEAVKTN